VAEGSLCAKIFTAIDLHYQTLFFFPRAKENYDRTLGREMTCCACTAEIIILGTELWQGKIGRQEIAMVVQEGKICSLNRRVVERWKEWVISERHFGVKFLKIGE
jgi:hypothetical protein